MQLSSTESLPQKTQGSFNYPSFLGGHTTFKPMANCCYNSFFFWNFYLTICDWCGLMAYMGVSLNGGTPKTPQKESFLVGKPIVVVYQHFRKPPYTPEQKKVLKKINTFLLEFLKNKNTHAGSAKAYSTFTQLHQYQ